MTAAELPGEVQSLIGQRRYSREADFCVNPSVVRAMCAAVENGNPVYWDAEAAMRELGAQYAPITLLSAWDRVELWSPESADKKEAVLKPLQLHFDLKQLFDYPVAIIGSFESVYHAPVRLGDQIRSYQTLLSVSDEKDTRLGRGRFWNIEVRYHNQCDELAGVDTFNCFGYRRKES